VADGKSHDQWLKLAPKKNEKVSGELRLRTQYLSALVLNLNKSGFYCNSWRKKHIW
jgi:hypothetical protein